MNTEDYDREFRYRFEERLAINIGQREPSELEEAQVRHEVAESMDLLEESE